MSASVTPRLTHQALLYDSDAAFLSAAAAFCRAGLDHGEKVLAVVGRPNLDPLRSALADDAADVELVPADEWYTAPGRTLAAYHRYVERHSVAHPGVRVIGEPVWQGRSPAEEAEWTRYESMINVAFAGSRATILCPYDTRTLPERITADARRTHPALDDPSAGPEAAPNPGYTDPEEFAHAADHLPLPAAPPDVEPILFGADLAAMRRRVARRAFALGAARELRERLLLAAHEVAANAVEHGGGHGRILLWLDGGTLLCEVDDPGRMNAPYAGYLPPAFPTDRGHGLWVVRQLCDLVEVRTGDTGTCLRLHLRP
ncbi:anti-sigma factor RsbA family regulatory protein [Nonomuraea sp. NPDC048826]|uniref:anti-sigma factor RsbA family regulatory protein n=1 Tax=Nonomuraea sp. NPDC048826 TaxID=3364347 RepID=UPI003719BDD8